jgi:hypothetical protein
MIRPALLLPAGLIVLNLGIVLLVLWLTGFLGAWRRSRLKGRGVSGSAEILAIGGPSRSATYTLVSAHLRIAVAGHAPYVVKTQVLLPSKYAGSAGPGATVPVWVDRASPGRVYVDWSQIPSDEQRLVERYGDNGPPQHL